MPFKVLVTDPVDEAFIKKVGKEAEIEVALKLTREELLEKVKEADALVVRSRTKVTREVIDSARRLKVIVRAGVGVDNIDVKAAVEKGVQVVNTPRAPTTSVAELAMGFMLALARGIVRLDKATKAGTWRKGEMGVELSGKVLGLVGLGSIGSEVARLAKGFGMKVQAYDPYAPREHANQLGVKLVELEELLRTSDFISIHVPLTPETRGLIGKEKLDLVKPGAFLINTARGGIVDEAALYEALKTGKLAGAALDVFEKEPPPPDHPLFTLDNFVATPHIGGSTDGAQLRIALTMAEDLLRVIKGEKPVNIVRVV